mmetsp:Transcript_6733/g.10761  ORF Transcript_6733/g.10761 Transcript_6733/m.10761 type:complete len:393 (+) Transcript_6733:155-1333(+)|eukprot:CAMPEP_0201967052 /NCGR_PEP_ID=MMETSP0904-20121228/11838_1 /ASSEMBLY_ACC=CAM_ASM_000553 /TAXON_ID=420261 /ORGANISM="Thalassiosira antarctica, Strain CCMP982" /LENGTH=392 /DNA_ID=CAMNT_0048514421 /DNA_START=98 /DNA_END=1276 /DNA_ORIENTATION=-
MKSLTPTSTAAIAILASATFDSVSADTFPYATPTFRFEQFLKLDATSQSLAEERLGYIELTWNNHGLAPIEKKGWSSLSSNERDGANLIGYTEGTWDCFINHYENYSWDELAEKGVQAHYQGLGWSQEHWEHTAADIVYTEGRWWGQLTDNEKKAANALCYFKENWDKVDMNPNPSFFPHPVPNFRFMPWNELSAVTQNVAGGMLNYTEATWNNLRTSVVEKNTFLNLDSDEREGAMDLGFYTHTWDCFMNHYLSYYWSSFHDDLKVAIVTLGWDEAMWSDESDTAPASEGKFWIDLTPDEKAAATRLCYFRETWDAEPITNWNTAVTPDGPLPKDINLDIFVSTGYVGREPGSVGAAAYTATTTDLSSSSIALASSNVLALVLSMGVFLFV